MQSGAAMRDVGAVDAVGASRSVPCAPFSGADVGGASVQMLVEREAPGLHRRAVSHSNMIEEARTILMGFVHYLMFGSED